jgi:CubicO group peptidase (beta-lactamase class C family)
MPQAFLSRLFLLFSLSVLPLAGCGGPFFKPIVDASDLESRRYAANHDLQVEVDSLAKPLLESEKVPGLVVGVLLADGESKFYSYGVTDTISQTRLNADTLFDIGSLSKIFLGLLAAQLVEDGTLSWNTTLASAFPNEILSDDAKTITLQDLATHTAGFNRQINDLKTLLYFIGYNFTGDDFYRHYDAKYIFDYLKEFDAPKEKDIVYSNVGYGLFGYAIEKITGKSLEDLLAAKIARPLRLQHTGYHLERLPAMTDRAYGHAGDYPKFVRRGQSVPDWQLTEFMKGAASMYSNARDLLLLAKAYIDGAGELHTALNDTLRVRFPRNREAQAIAWIVDSLDDWEIAYLDAVIAGYTSFIGLDKKHNQAVVVLHNGFNWTTNIGYQLLVRLGNAQEIENKHLKR